MESKMNNNNRMKIKLSSLFWVVIAVLLLFFWETILAIIIIGGILYLQWRCRNPILAAFQGFCEVLCKFFNDLQKK